MKDILFFSKYPKGDEIKDGMMQRVIAIDSEFCTKNRTYITLSRRTNFFIKKEKYNDRLTIFKVNIFLHFWFIIFQLMKHNNIYFHSLHNFYLIYRLSNFDNKNICLDAHGSVPEELEFYGNSPLSQKMQRVEKRLFLKLSTLITVSDQMAAFYREKYPFMSNRKIIVKPIFATNVMRKVSDNEANQLMVELGISPNKTVLIYSGNLQKWQNFDLMIDAIVTGMKPNYHIIILTGEPAKAKEIISNRIDNSQLTLRSVSPSELATYYNISHYGFILRDEHILNKVAAPTKLIEYLYYGIIPIVKYANIGDVAIMGYDYIKVDEICTMNLLIRKSVNNVEIAKSICSQNGNNPVEHIFD